MNRTKKIISIVLCLAMLISTIAVAGMTSVFASDAKKDGEICPLVFVPGIGQSQTYKYDDEGNVLASWNLLNVDMDIKPADYITLAKVAIPFLLSAFVGKNLIKSDNIGDVLKLLFKNCIIDENGNLPKNVETPVYDCPVSQYPEKAMDIFYSRIPCKDLIDEVGADNAYCYNYSSFSYTYKTAEGLRNYINNVVLPQTGAEKVILIPMSMGATVLNAYFDEYASDNKVEKVISIVGAWNGSDVFADLVERKFDEDAPEMFYNGLIAELVGEPYGYLVNLAVRIFPKAVLSDVIREILGELCKNLMFNTTSFLSLIPSERYESIAEQYFSGDDMKNIKAQTDKYYAYQKNLKQNIYNLKDTYGIDFYFISGYNLGFGSECSDFLFFQFFDSSDETNSDEVIQISSTAIGTSYVKAGTSFLSDYKAANPVCTDPTHNHISPDRSIDASTAIFPEKTWYFEGQTHELSFNNTAISLAFVIVKGNITCIQDCEDTYPQFNKVRDTRKLIRSYIPDAESVDRTTITAQQAERLEKALTAAKDMMKVTINNPEKDNAVIKELYNTLVDIGIYQEKVPSKSETVMTKIFKGMSDLAYKIFGAKGYSDFGK